MRKERAGENGRKEKEKERERKLMLLNNIFFIQMKSYSSFLFVKNYGNILAI